MATTFLEPGGDADFLVGTTNGFWTSSAGTPTAVNDFVHGNHMKSIKYGVNVNDLVRPPIGSIADTGSRVSIYIYLNALPNATATFLRFNQSGGVICFSLRMTSVGILQLWDGTTIAQIGTNGSALATGQWYRISLAYTITSTTVNRFEQFVNGVSSISVTNATLTNITTSQLGIGNQSPNLTLDMRSSDHYIDNSSSLTDTGDIWVTAKRPNANGTTNGFTTQIGSGGSGYGTGHSPQVNERPLSTANGWSMIGAGAAVTEEYNIENKSTGDIDISTATIVDYVGWASVSSLVGETINIILNGINFSQAITSTITLFKKIAGSSTYPTGTGVDIGIKTDTSLTTVSLYECGVLVAFIPAAITPTVSKNLSLLRTG